MARLISIVCALVALLVALTAAQNGKRTLVIVDDLSTRETHSNFFNSLTNHGFTLSFLAADSNDIVLKKYGEYLYDNLILFAPKADGYGRLGAEDVVAFIDAGHNVLAAASSAGASETLRDIASECGVEFDAQGTAVIDHFNADPTDDGSHTLVRASNFPTPTLVILGKSGTQPVLFRGIAHTVRDSTLNYPILAGFTTTVSAAVRGNKAPVLVGTRAGLVSALQARNSARAVFSGSLDLFSNAFFKVSPANSEFAVELTRWTFHERGVLRAHSVSHVKVGHGPQYMYTVKDDVEYSVVIEEFDGSKWVPFQADDVQLEFVRLDPYIRTTLKHDGKGKFSTTLKVPDVYGVFSFKIEYRRPGYTPLFVNDRAPVRPFRHDQYERFIVSAFPYYAGALSMLAGVFVFSVVFLFHDDSRK